MMKTTLRWSPEAPLKGRFCYVLQECRADITVSIMEVWQLDGRFGVYEKPGTLYPIATFPTLGEAQRYAEVLYQLTH